MPDPAPSPLLSGAVEDFEHAAEHMNGGTPRDFKYTVINLGQSIELVLKEKVRTLGVSVFERKPPYRSLGFYDCLKILNDKGIAVPRQSDIEIVHEERNWCIHMGGRPDVEKTNWLFSVARSFMQDFCSHEFGISIGRFLPPEVSSITKMEAKRVHLSPANIYFVDAVTALDQKRYEDTVLNASIGIELLLRGYLERRGKKITPFFSSMVAEIENEGKVPPVVIQKIKELHSLRNEVAHLRVKPTSDEAKRAEALARFVFEGFEEVWKREKRCVVCGSTEVVGAEWEVSVDTSQIGSVKDLEKILLKSASKRRKLSGYYCKEHEPYWAR
jgi:HEPN domain-containing protein